MSNEAPARPAAGTGEAGPEVAARGAAGRAGRPGEEPVVLGGELRLADVVAIAEGAPARFGEGVAERVRASRAVVEAALASGAVVYGVTTGFGSLAEVRLSPEHASALQHGLVRSHAVAVGDELSVEEVRAMLALRAHVLALGCSGVRLEVAERFLELLEHGIYPVVPEQGSLGASGDLAPLAHLALGALGEGRVRVRGGSEAVPAAPALAAAGLAPITLEAKEGLALINGTQGMTAVGALAAHRAGRLAKTADVAAALTIEAILGTDRAFDPRVIGLRPHPGQQASARNLVRLLERSEILASHREGHHIVQDAYSIRCAPQVHGALRDVIANTVRTLEVEMASVSDNPIVLAGDGEILSCGNFHGQPVAHACDSLAAALVSTASISERRLYRLLDPKTSNGLAPFLVGEAGVNSGFMVCQYTAASLVSESKSLAHPAAVDSITSSAGQEDHVSMGMIAARHARACVANAEAVVALELLAAAQGCELRAPLRPAPGTGAALGALRRRIAHLDHDRELKPDVDAAIELVRSGELLEAVEGEIGALE
ncbi:MAG TPA: histidine ammonia-lyase [Acidimicrobiales bacterium]|nr:histidine ammonia-lyase [Acidimicrobiales bacterium]